MNQSQIKSVISVVLHRLGYHSKSAVELVFLTGLVESNYAYLRQLGGGPAKSFFQIEPATCKDIVDNYVKYRSKLQKAIGDAASIRKRWDAAPTDELSYMLETNIAFAICMCRVHYRRVPKALPKIGDKRDFASYWKSYYNTELGAGTVEKFLDVESRRKDGYK